MNISALVAFLSGETHPAKVLRFLVTGTTAAGINVLFLYLFTQYAHIWYVYSSILSFVIAFVFNFGLQKYWVFQSTDHAKIPTQLSLHLGAALFNLGLNTVFLYCLVEYAHLWYVFAQLISSAVIACESFVVFRWIFR